MAENGRKRLKVAGNGTDTPGMRNSHAQSLPRIARRTLIGALAVLATLMMTNAPSAEALNAVTMSSGPDASSADASPVEIGDDGIGVAMFDGSLLTPGDTLQSCIVLTYSGTALPSGVSLYGSVSGDGLDAYLDLTIDVGTGGHFNDCGGFAPSAPLFSGTLASFAAAHTNFANGLQAWSPTGNSESRTYRITVSLQDDNGAQGKTAGVDFIWETQSR